MAEILKRKVNPRSGTIRLPQGMRDSLAFNSGDTIFKCNIGISMLLIHEGSEIVLIDELFGGNTILKDARRRNLPDRKSGYWPTSIFSPSEVHLNGGIFISHRPPFIGADLSIQPVGQGVLLTPATEDLPVLTQMLPQADSGYSWTLKPRVTAESLKFAYYDWRNARAQAGETEFAEQTTTLGSMLQELVTKDIEKKAAHLKR